MQLHIDKKYRNTNNWKLEDDEFNKMFRNFSDNKGIQNAGGFRYKSRKSSDGKIENAAFVLLITNFGEHEWPDSLEMEIGVFTYFGDNRTPGKKIEETRIGGNRLLQIVFHKLHRGDRSDIPPFLIFENMKLHNRSYMKFLGLAVPGAKGFNSIEDLVAIWRVQDGKRFQNYRAKFTILKEETINWKWLQDIVDGVKTQDSSDCPKSWKNWITTGRINALECETQEVARDKSSQLPDPGLEKEILSKLLDELSDRDFEYTAKEILHLLDKNFIDLEVTPRSRDGGRDIIGNYQVGHSNFKIKLSIHAEAKRWKNGVGVKPMARLISRIKHKDIGIFITTSYFDQQVQNELLEDKHHIILICGKDIVKILMENDIAGENYKESFSDWLSSIKLQVQGE